MHTPFHRDSFLPSVFERLEDRVLFDGVPDAMLVFPGEPDVGTQAVQIEYVNQAELSVPRDLIDAVFGIIEKTDLEV